MHAYKTIDGFTEEFDKEAFTELLLRSFGRIPVEDYYETTKPDVLYLAQDQGTYMGAIVGVSLGDILYLDKVACSEKGLASGLWERMRSAHPKHTWKSDINNPHQAFYSTRHDRSVIAPDFSTGKVWRHYGYGLTSGEFESARNHAIGRGCTLIDPLAHICRSDKQQDLNLSSSQMIP